MAMTHFTVWSVSVGKHTQDSFPSDRLRQLVRTVLVSSPRLSCLEPSQWLWAEAAFRSLNPPSLSLYTPWPPAPQTCQVGLGCYLRFSPASYLEPGDPRQRWASLPAKGVQMHLSSLSPTTEDQEPGPRQAKSHHQNSSPFALETNQ